MRRRIGRGIITEVSHEGWSLFFFCISFFWPPDEPNMDFFSFTTLAGAEGVPTFVFSFVHSGEKQELLCFLGIAEAEFPC